MKTNYILMTVAALTMTVSSFAAHAEDAKKTDAKPAATAAAASSPFGPVDANNDGVVTKAEADAAAMGEFGVFDANKDGKISKDEFKTVLYKINEKALTDDAAKAKAQPMIDARFANLDTNKDSNISKDEFLADSTKRHKMFDENGDGKVTKAEVDDVNSKLKAKFEAMKAAAEKNAAAAAKPAVKTPATDATTPATAK